jgi:hypothetical protein
MKAKFKTKGLIDFSSGGKIIIVNWDKRQFASDSSKERVSKHREKKKKQEETNYWNKELEKLQEHDNRPDFNKLPRLKSYDPHKEKHDE